MPLPRSYCLDPVEVMFNAYREHSPSRGHMPTWATLPEKYKDAWRAAAEAYRKEVSR